MSKRQCTPFPYQLSTRHRVDVCQSEPKESNAALKVLLNGPLQFSFPRTCRWKWTVNLSFPHRDPLVRHRSTLSLHVKILCTLSLGDLRLFFFLNFLRLCGFICKTGGYNHNHIQRFRENEIREYTKLLALRRQSTNDNSSPLPSALKPTAGRFPHMELDFWPQQKKINE